MSAPLSGRRMTPPAPQGRRRLGPPPRQGANRQVRPSAKRNGRSERPVFGSSSEDVCLPDAPGRKGSQDPSLVRRIKIRPTACVTSSQCQTPVKTCPSKPHEFQTSNNSPDKIAAPPKPKAGGARQDRRASKAQSWWSQTGSNRRPHACKARALPTELWPLKGDATHGPKARKADRPPRQAKRAEAR